MFSELISICDVAGLIIVYLISSNEKFNDLGSIIIDPTLGRKNKEDITICDLTGTGVQDTAIARYTYNICKKNNLGINT